MSLMRSLLLQASRNPWMRQHVPSYRFVQRAVRRFMPGEDIESAMNAARRISGDGIGAVFTYLGENVQSAGEAEAVAAHYVDVLRQIAGSGLDAEVSVKLTQLGHDLGTATSLKHLQSIVEEAEHAGTFVWIDMEDSSYVDSTLDVFRQLRARHANVGLCVQAYLYRTAADLTALYPLHPAIRLVKGAYREPASVAFPSKADVDANFLKLATGLLDASKQSGGQAVFATHDQKLFDEIPRIAAQHDVDKGRFEFQVLYGIRNDALRDLARAGHTCRILIAYGPAWYPWYMRRLAERPANVWFVLKNLWS